MTRRLAGALCVLLFVTACAAEPPPITSAGTMRIEVDPDAPTTTAAPPTSDPEASSGNTTAPGPTTTVEATATTSPPRTTTRPSPPGTTAPQATTAPAQTTTTTTPKQRVNLLCDSFLQSQRDVYESVYLGAMEDVRRALRPGSPERVRNAVDTLIAEDRLPAERRNRLTAIVEQEVVGECRSRYFQGVEPRDDVVNSFFNLVVAGRRPAAATMAPAHVIARFEPWQPWPRTELISPGLRIQSDTSFIMALSETVEARCTHFAGTIRSCFLSLSN